MKKLAIINSDPKECSYGGVAPIMRNMHDTLSSTFDLEYFYLPDSWKKTGIPCRALMLLYMLVQTRRIRQCDFILSHVPEASYIVSFFSRPYAHIYHGNVNPMEGSRYSFGKYFTWVFELFFKRISKTACLRYTVGPVWDGVKKLYNPIVQNVDPVPVSDRRGFIFCGRLENMKNIDRLIDVYSCLPLEMRKENPFYIAGNGTCGDMLRKHAEDSGTGDSVVFLGPVANSEILTLDSTKKILIMASSFEGFPTAIAEALSVGVPVVTTDVGDISRIVKDGYNGRLLPKDFRNEDYVGAIESVMSDYATYSANAYASSGVFSNTAITESLAHDIMKTFE